MRGAQGAQIVKRQLESKSKSKQEKGAQQLNSARQESHQKKGHQQLDSVRNQMNKKQQWASTKLLPTEDYKEDCQPQRSRLNSLGSSNRDSFDSFADR